MVGMFRADLRKLFHMKSFYVCLILAGVLGAVMSMLYQYFWQERGRSIALSYNYMRMVGMDTTILDTALESLPKNNLWSYINTFLSDGMLWYLGSVSLCAYFSAEFSEGTFRNAISRGCSRIKLFFSKFITGFMEILAIELVYECSGVIAAFPGVSRKPTIATEKIISILLCYILLIAAVTAFMLMLSAIFRRTGLSLAVGLVAPMILVSILGIITMSDPEGAAMASRFVLMQTFVNVQEYELSGDGLLTWLIGGGYLLFSAAVGAAVFRLSEIR